MITSDENNLSKATAATSRRRFSTLSLVGIPALTFIFSLLLAGTVAYLVYGAAGFAICIVVWAVIVVSAVAAYLIGSIFSSAEMFQSQMMIGMGIRTGIPLAFALWVVEFSKSWLDYGCIYYLFTFYFLGLAVDVFMMVATFRPEPAKAAEKSAMNSSTANISP